MPPDERLSACSNELKNAHWAGVAGLVAGIHCSWWLAGVKAASCSAATGLPNGWAAQPNQRFSAHPNGLYI